jgi:hypothetical protein
VPDVFVVQLTERLEVDLEKLDFAVSLNQLGAGGTPQDMTLYGSGETRRLLVAAGNQALIIDANTSRVTAVPLDQSATRVLLFDAAAPFDSSVEKRALLYAPDGNSLTFLDLDRAEERGARSTEMLTLGSAFKSLLPLPNSPGFVLAVHTNGVSLVDLADRTVTPISVNANLEDAIPDPVLNRAWLVPPGQPRVGYLDLDTFHPDEVRLDADIRYALPLTRAEVPRFVAVHDSPLGHVTILDGSEPKDLKSAVSLQGFLVSGALD